MSRDHAPIKENDITTDRKPADSTETEDSEGNYIKIGKGAPVPVAEDVEGNGFKMVISPEGTPETEDTEGNNLKMK